MDQQFKTCTQRLPSDKKRDREQKNTADMKQTKGLNTYLGTTCHGSVKQRQVLTPFFRMLISTAFIVVRGVGCLWVTGVMHVVQFFGRSVIS